MNFNLKAILFSKGGIMNYLIYGAGTIGITYAYLLSQNHYVDLLVKSEKIEKISNGINIYIKDLRKKATNYKKVTFVPNCVTDIEKQYDGILVAVNRLQLESVLPQLIKKQEYTKYYAFMQNNWNIKVEIEHYFSTDKYIIAFPSSLGGGLGNKGLDVIIFEEATRLGGQCLFGINNLQEALKQVSIKAEYDAHIFDWLKVHYLQQSITAGAVLECGNFLTFAHDYNAVKKMVKAFREGIEVCRLQGVNTFKTFPANLFKLPVFVIAYIMQKMFLNTNTIEMVNNHMKKGLPEWVAGYKEVLVDGLALELPMTVWKSYDNFVENYLKQHNSLKKSN